MRKGSRQRIRLVNPRCYDKLYCGNTGQCRIMRIPIYTTVLLLAQWFPNMLSRFMPCVIDIAFSTVLHGKNASALEAWSAIKPQLVNLTTCFGIGFILFTTRTRCISTPIIYLVLEPDQDLSDV